MRTIWEFLRYFAKNKLRVYVSACRLVVKREVRVQKERFSATGLANAMSDQ